MPNARGAEPAVGLFQPRQLLHRLSGSELQLHKESSSKRSESSKLKRPPSSQSRIAPSSSTAATVPPPAPHWSAEAATFGPPSAPGHTDRYHPHTTRTRAHTISNSLHFTPSHNTATTAYWTRTRFFNLLLDLSHSNFLHNDTTIQTRSFMARPPPSTTTTNMANVEHCERNCSHLWFRCPSPDKPIPETLTIWRFIIPLSAVRRKKAALVGTILHKQKEKLYVFLSLLRTTFFNLLEKHKDENRQTNPN